VRIRIGQPLTFPRVEQASPQLAAAVTDRIWPNVMLQWEWLGGLPPLRRAAVIGAGSWGSAVAAMLARAGLQVDLARASDEAVAEPPAGVRRAAAAELDLTDHDLVCFASRPDALAAIAAVIGPRIPHRAGVLVRGGDHALAVVREHSDTWAAGELGGAAHPAAALHDGARMILAAEEPAFRRQVAEALSAAGFPLTAVSELPAVRPADSPRTPERVRAA
jgi:hypothetical protein